MVVVVVVVGFGIGLGLKFGHVSVRRTICYLSATCLSIELISSPRRCSPNPIVADPAPDLYCWIDDKQRSMNFSLDINTSHTIIKCQGCFLSPHNHFCMFTTTTIPYLSPITDHRSPITNHRSPITDHRSPITNHRQYSKYSQFQTPTIQYVINASFREVYTKCVCTCM